MADNTSLNPASGGDVVRTDASTDASGNTVKTQLVKIGLGRSAIQKADNTSSPAVDEGAVTRSNPLPTADARLQGLVEESNDLLRQGNDLLQQIFDVTKPRGAGARPLLGF